MLWSTGRSHSSCYLEENVYFHVFCSSFSLEVDPEGNRTVGVLTKLDKLTSATDRKRVAEDLDNKNKPLKLGSRFNLKSKFKHKIFRRICRCRQQEPGRDWREPGIFWGVTKGCVGPTGVSSCEEQDRSGCSDKDANQHFGQKGEDDATELKTKKWRRPEAHQVS